VTKFSVLVFENLALYISLSDSLFTYGSEDVLGLPGDFLNELDDLPNLSLNLGAI
jgi:hypothetical protein